MKIEALDSISFKINSRKELIEIKTPYCWNKILKRRSESRFHWKITDNGNSYLIYVCIFAIALWSFYSSERAFCSQRGINIPIVFRLRSKTFRRLISICVNKNSIFISIEVNFFSNWMQSIQFLPDRQYICLLVLQPSRLTSFYHLNNFLFLYDAYK